MDMSQYKGLFVAESREHLHALNELIVALEKDPLNRENIDSLFRAAHSIKGMAASMGYGGIAELAHKMEDLMDRVRKGILVFDAGAADLLLEGADLLEEMIRDVESDASGGEDIGGLLQRLIAYGTTGGSESGTPRDATQYETEKGDERKRDVVKGSGEAQQTVRIRTEVLDSLINTTGELITNKQRLLDIASEVQSPRLDEALREYSRLLRELHNEVLLVRMMPFAVIADRFPRMVRDLAKKSGKEVVFTARGKDLEIDRGILEALSDPLVHVVRNAVDHGVETVSERTACGKDPTGTITLSARREKDQVIIVVEDDGRGMDPAKLIASAIAKGIIRPEEGERMSPRQAFLLTCAPGFSTAKEVTDVSGRGVGMDAVRASVQALGGVLSIESEVGVGSRIILKLPLTIAIINVLLVALAHMTVAVPVTGIQRTLELKRNMITRRGNHQVFCLDDETLPLLSLGRMCGLPHTPVTGRIVPVFVTELKGRRVGLVVDRLIGHREVFVKPLGKPLEGVKGLAGGAILGDGEVIFILDVANML